MGEQVVRDETGQVVVLNKEGYREGALLGLNFLKEIYTDQKYAKMLPPGVNAWVDPSNNEAFLAGKPVITTTDAGGPTEFVVDGVNGRVTAPDPAALGEAIAFLAGDSRRAAALGEAGYERARHITWAGVVEALIKA